MKQPSASASEREMLRLERLAGLLGPGERESFWAGVVAALRSADRLDEGHTVDLLGMCSGKVKS